MHPTHPRQTLIQPAAPPAPPKILPALPNIVQLAANAEPARPRLQLTAMRPEMPPRLAAPDASTPNLSVPDKQIGTINIAASAQALPKPALPVTPMSAPRAAAQRGEKNIGAPEISARTADAATIDRALCRRRPRRLLRRFRPGIFPRGFRFHPMGRSRARPAESRRAAMEPLRREPAAGAARKVFSSPAEMPPSPAQHRAWPSGRRQEGLAIRWHRGPRRARESLPENSNLQALNSSSSKKMSKLDVAPEKVLAGKQVYTLHVNMPNLTSASGSWILNFAELNEDDPLPYSRAGATDLAGPVPFRKVDPKYPPELRTEHVEGEVVLYAIIRKDGSVDSIQLVHSVDPRLDANAMEALAQWKFRPAEKRGEPVDLEAVVHMPFRSSDSRISKA